MSEFNEELEPQETQDEQLAPSEEEEDSSGSDDTEEESEVTRLQRELEETRRDKNGLIKKVTALEKTSRPSPKPQVSANENERLDRLELRMLDKDLTSEQIQDILLIKKAKGLTDVSEAYSHPMVSSWLTSSRSEKETDDKIRKATPKAQRNMTSQPQEKKITGIKYNKDWVQEIPSDNTRKVAQMLEESILADD
jgi:hypothetical protein